MPGGGSECVWFCRVAYGEGCVDCYCIVHWRSMSKRDKLGVTTWSYSILPRGRRPLVADYDSPTLVWSGFNATSRVSMNLYLPRNVEQQQHMCTLETHSEPAYSRRWPHHCQSSVHGCRLLATELFASPLPAPGTTCRATSRLHHLCLFSEAIWRRTSSGVLFRNFCQVPAKWLLSLLTLLSLILLTHASEARHMALDELKLGYSY